MVLTECNANWTCSLDDDEPWDMRFHFQGCDNLERTLCESDITYINMLAIIGIEGYDQKDSMYYVKQEGVGMAGMQLIKSEEDVEEMLILYEEKRWEIICCELEEMDMWLQKMGHERCTM